MQIQSSFKDYYDGAVSTGIDKTIIYKRSNSEVQLEDGFFIDDLPQHFPDNFGREVYINGMSHPDRQYCKWMIIGFCGVYYVAVFNTMPDDVKTHSMAYFGEDILKLDWQERKSSRKFVHPKVIIEQMLKQWHLKTDNDLFFKFNSPIFVKEIQHSLSKYEWKNKQLYLNKFEINPNLNNYQFYKVQDAFTAFQALQSYISGVLGTKENQIIEVSNKDKIVKAGFDLKTSFRKDKEK